MRVLFLCTGNSCRSQMAEGLLRHLSSGRVEAFSAGTHPKPVHPLAVRVMHESGIDITHHTSKSPDQFLGQPFDAIITVCDRAKESCPIFSGAAQRLHWSLEDPDQATGTEKERLQVFRNIRDDMARRVAAFLTQQPGTEHEACAEPGLPTSK